jgi:hypothetical protein
MPYPDDMTDAKPTVDRDDARAARRPYSPPAVTKLGRIEDLTSAGSGGIMEHGMAGSTFSQA